MRCELKVFLLVCLSSLLISTSSSYPRPKSQPERSVTQFGRPDPPSSAGAPSRTRGNNNRLIPFGHSNREPDLTPPVSPGELAQPRRPRGRARARIRHHRSRDLQSAADESGYDDNENDDDGFGRHNSNNDDDRHHNNGGGGGDEEQEQEKHHDDEEQENDHGERTSRSDHDGGGGGRRRHHRGGYDAHGQDIGYGEGYGYGGEDEYCQGCRHCNGCGHAPNQKYY